MPVTGVEHQVHPLDPGDDLGRQGRRIDRTVGKAEELEGDLDALLRRQVSSQHQPGPDPGKGLLRREAGDPGWNRQQVRPLQLAGDTQARAQVCPQGGGIDFPARVERQPDAVEAPDLALPDTLRRTAYFIVIDQQPLGPGFDSDKASLSGYDQRPIRRGGHDRGAVEEDLRTHFSRITPKVNPATMYRRPITISRSGTSMAITPAAAISFQMISNWVTRPWTPTGKVWAFGVAVRIRANRNSLQAKVNTMVAAAISPGVASGRSTRRKEVHRLAPSTRATSSIPIGISARKPLSIQIAKGRLKSE